MRPRVITRGKTNSRNNCCYCENGFNEAARDHARKGVTVTIYALRNKLQ